MFEPVQKDSAHEPSAHEPNAFDAVAAAQPSSTASGDSIQMLISLFIILLSFFVILNSVSSRETAKTEAAVKSLNSIFSRPAITRVDLLATEGDPSGLSEQAQFYNDAKALFSSLVDFPGKFAGDGGSVMQAELPASVLFASDDIHVRADQTLFLNGLADFIQTGPVGERRVEITVAVPSAQSLSVQGGDKTMRRAASFAQELQDRGVSGSDISAGVVVDSRAYVWLTFRNMATMAGAQ